jgi:hypothetical protein
MNTEMIIYRKGFQKAHNDTIAVVYEVTRTINRDGIEHVTRAALKPHPIFDRYYFQKDKEYQIICGLTEYSVLDNTVVRTFISRRHPFYNSENLD